MRTLSLVKGSVHLVLVAVLAGCGGGETPPAKAPEAEAKPAPKAEAPKDEEPKDEESADTGAKTKKVGDKKPKDVIGDPELAFMYSFKDSDVRDKKDEECTKKAKDDPEKKAACMSKAQAEVEADGMRFLKDDKGDTWFVVFHRQGEKVTELTRVKYTIGKETGTTITLSLTGKDLGKKPAFPSPSDLTIEIVDDYTIALNDSSKGKMVYRGKTGLFSDTSTTKPAR